MTTKEMMSIPEWPKIKKAIDESIAMFQALYPLDKVELVDKGDRFHIEHNGNPITEIDGDFLVNDFLKDLTIN